ncbi:Gata transcription factor [Thalictrum thalictroides]|uniref:Gata transcription factor n=1 Tax=Thalictrum thalictroides TaxID=46969 RepID=A0A7J6VHF8_THATH|nr:Gata transcription factor [Thalictrum thalictroides]
MRMESLESAALSIENLLDFPSDIDEEEEQQQHDNDDDINKKNLSLSLLTNNQPINSAELTISDSDAHLRPFPGLEEELEWLDGNAFPEIDTFLSVKPNCNNVSKDQSPVSVLGNSNSSLRHPVQARSKRRRRRRSSFADLPGQQWWFSYEPKIKKKNVGPTRMSTTSSSGRRCLHCLSEKTPQWRAGPLGPKTLCNACGVRYKSGRLLPEYRPANSPTFSGELHSNSHRKILDMRRQKYKEPFLPTSDQGVVGFCFV